MPELCSLGSVCGQACVYRHTARCVFTTIFINHKYSCSGVFNFILPSQAPHEDIQEEDYVAIELCRCCVILCHALLDVPACYAGYRQPCIDQALTLGAN